MIQIDQNLPFLMRVKHLTRRYIFPPLLFATMRYDAVIRVVYWCAMYISLTNHSLSSSLMKRPGQSESFNKILQFQQTVNALATEKEKLDFYMFNFIYGCFHSVITVSF